MKSEIKCPQCGTLLATFDPDREPGGVYSIDFPDARRVDHIRMGLPITFVCKDPSCREETTLTSLERKSYVCPRDKKVMADSVHINSDMHSKEVLVHIMKMRGKVSCSGAVFPCFNSDAGCKAEINLELLRKTGKLACDLEKLSPLDLPPLEKLYTYEVGAS